MMPRLMSRLQNSLLTPSKRLTEPQTLFWLTLSLAIALAYGLMAWQQAIASDYVVQDDARQHVFWMQRFINPELFPQDLIADYFESVAPAGYKAVYWVAAQVGIDPLAFHKILPIGLNLITAALCFGVSLQFLPIPFVSFVSTVLLGQGLGLTDAIVSATPKAFVYPLLLLFLWAMQRRSPWGVAGAIALQGLFYPQLVFISAGMLPFQLMRWQDGRLRFTQERGVGLPGRSPYRQLVLLGISVAFLSLLPYALQTNDFGPTLTAAEARTLPEFSLEGSRSRYFYDDDPATYWLKGRSGLRLATALTPATNVLGLLLPGLLLLPRAFPLAQQIRRAIALLPQMLVSSLVMFGAAHLLLFRLHLPSRYTQHSFRVVVTLAAAIAIGLLIDGALRWGLSEPARSQGIAGIRAIAGLGITSALTLLVLAYPALTDQFPITAYQTGTATELYELLQAQPADTLIASLSDEADNLPSFTQRSVLAASEYAIPYHQGYYSEFRQRVSDLIRAQYSPDPAELAEVIERYGIDVWLLDRRAFEPKYVRDRPWIQPYDQEVSAALAVLNGEEQPVLAIAPRRCTLLRKQGLILLDAVCVVESLGD
ncbi:MAG: hypothetical protein WBA57_06605 [Elainellaceae cyanobacterium]